MILPRVFTVSEANALVPLLVERMGRIEKLVGDAQVLQDRLEGNAPSADRVGEGVAMVDAGDPHTSLQVVEKMIQDELTGIGRLGVTVKGLTPPTVDAPALRNGRPVNLCWSLGEDAFDHWHPVDRGYDERVPLDEADDFGAELPQ